MSLQRRINRRSAQPAPAKRSSTVEVASENNADKGLKNGSCNRTACQHPLAEEPTHQFMAPPFTAGERLYYCAHCSLDFDRIDEQNRLAGASTLPNRITREPKVCEPVA